MTNKISMLDKINSCNFTIGEFVEGVKDWLKYIKCMEIDVDNTSMTLETFVEDILGHIQDNAYYDY